jgi:hypothetical protein
VQTSVHRSSVKTYRRFTIRAVGIGRFFEARVEVGLPRLARRTISESSSPFASTVYRIARNPSSQAVSCEGSERVVGDRGEHRKDCVHRVV